MEPNQESVLIQERYFGLQYRTTYAQAIENLRLAQEFARRCYNICEMLHLKGYASLKNIYKLLFPGVPVNDISEKMVFAAKYGQLCLQYRIALSEENEVVLTPVFTSHPYLVQGD